MVLETDAGVAGWVYGHELAHPDGERTMLLYALDVAEEHRGRGYGSALVRAFVHEATDRGCTEVWVLTDRDNDAGMATYAAAGGSPDGGGRSCSPGSSLRAVTPNHFPPSWSGLNSAPG